MIIVILESPYAGDIERNTEYAKKCMLDSLRRGEAPMVSHLLYTQVLDDSNEQDRELGIKAGLSFGTVASKTVVYTDYGISKGMEIGISNASDSCREIEYRTIL